MTDNIADYKHFKLSNTLVHTKEIFDKLINTIKKPPIIDIVVKNNDIKLGTEAVTDKEKRVQFLVDLTQKAIGKGMVYSGPLSLAPLEKKDVFCLPKSNKIWNGKDGSSKDLAYGFTCGTFAHMALSTIISNPNKTWRTGRSADRIWRFSASRPTIIDGSPHYGYKEYFTPIYSTWQKGSLLGKTLYENVDKLGEINLLEFSHHVVLILLFNNGFSIIDPNTNIGVPTNIPIRFGADGNYVHYNGNKYYSGKRHVFRAFDPAEKTDMMWRLFKLQDLNDNCQFENGPLAYQKLLPVKLEGLEHLPDFHIPTKQDAINAGLIKV